MRFICYIALYHFLNAGLCTTKLFSEWHFRIFEWRVNVVGCLCRLTTSLCCRQERLQPRWLLLFVWKGVGQFLSNNSFRLSA